VFESRDSAKVAITGVGAQEYRLAGTFAFGYLPLVGNGQFFRAEGFLGGKLPHKLEWLLPD